MSPSEFPRLSLAQVVRFDVKRTPTGLLVARSADMPGRVAMAFSMDRLAEEIRDAITRHFAGEDERVRVRRAGGHNDVSTWHVEVIEAADGRRSA